MKGAPIRYSRAELAFVRDRAAQPRRELHAAFVKRFGRTDVTRDHIKSLCTRNGWSTGFHTPWRRRDEALLRKLYPTTPTVAIARRLGRSVVSVYGRARDLGLRKSEAYLSSSSVAAAGRNAAGRVADGYLGQMHRFTKGHVPANKGLRRPGFSRGRMQETQFKKGERTNWMPVGSVRFMDGYHYTKVSDVPKVPYMVNWKPTHVLRWVELHGPVPPKHVLKCVGADKGDPDPSNWTCIPRGLLPRLNGIHGHGYDTAPAALKPTILALAQLEHAIGERVSPQQRRQQRRRRA